MKISIIIPVFNENFCNEIISIAESAPKGETIHEINGETVIVNGWGKERHKGEYSTYDIDLKSLGLYSVYEAFLKEFIYPLMWFLFRELSKPPSLFSETFLVSLSLLPTK